MVSWCFVLPCVCDGVLVVWQYDAHLDKDISAGVQFPVEAQNFFGSCHLFDPLLVTRHEILNNVRTLLKLTMGQP